MWAIPSSIPTLYTLAPVSYLIAYVLNKGKCIEDSITSIVSRNHLRSCNIFSTDKRQLFIYTTKCYSVSKEHIKPWQDTESLKRVLLSALSRCVLCFAFTRILHFELCFPLNTVVSLKLLWKMKRKEKKKYFFILQVSLQCLALGLVISWTTTWRLWHARAKQTEHSSRIITSSGCWKSAAVTGLHAVAVKEHGLLWEMSQWDCHTSQSLEGHREVISRRETGAAKVKPAKENSEKKREVVTMATA